MALEDLAEEILAYLEMLIASASSMPSAAAIGEMCNNLSSLYRSIGIVAFLVSGETDPFFHGLIQAALTRKYYLDRCRTERHVDEAARRASFVDPFLDAVAANQLPLARDIAALCPDDWMEGSEYEDDFAYAHFLYELLSARDVSCQTTLARFERALEGSRDTRLDVCTALLDRNQQTFDDGFATLIRERQRRMDELADPQRDSLLAQEYNFQPNRHVFVEGLALLRIADERGLVTEPEYPLCPALLRQFGYAAFKPISFPDLELTS